jgi:hypothetical protein
MSKSTNDPAAMLAAAGEASTSHSTRSEHSWASQQADDSLCTDLAEQCGMSESKTPATDEMGEATSRSPLGGDQQLGLPEMSDTDTQVALLREILELGWREQDEYAERLFGDRRKGLWKRVAGG